MDFAPIVLDGATRVLNFSALDTRAFHTLIATAAADAGIKGARVGSEEEKPDGSFEVEVAVSVPEIGAALGLK